MNKTTALIVEDSPTQALIISRMIQALGWSTYHCATIREACETLAGMSVQAIFLDVFVGQHNGLLHIDRFRKLAPDAPLSVMTAGSSAVDVNETLKAARAAGADYVLRKPFNEIIVKDIFTSAYQDLDKRKPRRHALVIDDSQTIRTLVVKTFERAGFRTSAAETMEEAFANVDIANVDLVLCDIFMPGMGGLKGMRTIKQTWPKVKIIAMSAGIEARVSQAEALNAARKIGADAQICKPFRPDDLREVVENLIPESVSREMMEV